MPITPLRRQLSTETACLKHLEAVRWGKQPMCPYCTSPKVTRYRETPRYHCNSCDTSFSLTVRTIFHRSHVKLCTWFQALLALTNPMETISVRKLADELRLNKNTILQMKERIQRATAEERQLLDRLVQSLVEPA